MTSQLITTTNANCNLDSNPIRSSHPELEHLAATMPAATTDTIRSQSRLSISHAKGLLNMPGQNNCFLNSAVQVLWHLDVFRRNFREITGHACMGDSCIFCALKELFNQFQCSSESALPPDSLRAALAQSFSDQRRFQLGFMDDAAECFENILLRIHYHITNHEINDSSIKCSPHCIPHQKFAMNLYEQIICHSCGGTSEPFVFSQMVHYTSTSALCSQEKLFKNNNLSFGSLLKMASSIGDIRNCPKMCGTRINIKKTLVNRPDIISIGLVWDSEHPTLTLIRNIFQIIEINIKLDEVFDLNAQPESFQRTDQQLNLVGLVTYYGKHYSTYLYHTKLCQWIYFDDATVRIIGPYWQQVIDKCVKGHFQPLLLLYSNPNGTVVNTQHAFKEIIPMTVFNNSKTTIQSHLNNDCSKLKLSSDISSSNLQNQLNVSSTTNAFDYNKSLKAINNSVKYYSDVPDSPSATSTTSYFSDIGDLTDCYITRKTVENIMKIQRNSANHKKVKDYSDLSFNLFNFNKKCNRNSSSSLESFDSMLRQNNLPKSSKINERNLICSLQRRDSGNSSGDRSSSVSSIDPPHHPHRSRSFKNAQYSKSCKHNSDQGYDSFSISSSDSYPTGSSASPSKINQISNHNNKLKQIPEDVQMFDMFNSMTMSECDKLCSEADILLLKSHEKEREGDLRAAAALSDSAALKARVAMDTPYSNHQNLITAKMKHSMCVMRSTSLHKRVQEMEAEEKRLLKSAQEYHHSRQSSRDSTHGRHSRQGSKDSKDPKTAKDIEFKQTKHSPNIASNSNVEIYATLPKKAKPKKIFNKHSSSNSANEEYKVVSSKAKYFNEPEFIRNLNLNNDNLHDSLMKKKNKPNHLFRDSDYSDYCSEWDGLNKKTVPTNKQTASGSQSCRENDSEFYGEIGTITTNQKKQCKVKRKLLLGNLLKTKNRSLPDLREDAFKEKDKSSVLCEEVAITNRTSVANINAKGFHQVHRSFVTEHGVYTKPSLLKVKPPLIVDISTHSSNVEFTTFRSNSYLATNVPNKIEPLISEKTKLSDQTQVVNNQAPSSFLLELNKKRLEIMKNYDESCDNLINRNLIKMNQLQSNARAKLKKPSSREIATFISNNSVAISHKSCTNGMNQKVKAIVNDLSNNFADTTSDKMVNCARDSPVSKSMSNVHVPIAIHPPGNNPNLHLSNYSSQHRIMRPPDYATTIKRIGMNMNMPFPPPPPHLLENHYENFSTLKDCGVVQPAATDQAIPNECRIYSQDAIKLPVALPCSNEYNVDKSKLANINQTSELGPTYGNKQGFRENFLNCSVKRKTSTKKSVKFSDHIEMVACAEEEREEHLPNPLIEKVFGKNFLYSFDQ